MCKLSHAMVFVRGKRNGAMPIEDSPQLRNVNEHESVDTFQWSGGRKAVDLLVFTISGKSFRVPTRS